MGFGINIVLLKKIERGGGGTEDRDRLTGRPKTERPF